MLGTEQGTIDYETSTDAKTQLLRADERLSRKSALTEIFELSRTELDDLLDGVGDSGKAFVAAVSTLEEKVWKPARQTTGGAQDSQARQRGAGFEAAYALRAKGESGGRFTFSDPKPGAQETWGEAHWCAWFLHKTLYSLWQCQDGPLFGKGLKEEAAAQRIWYLMQRWSHDHSPSRRQRTEDAAARRAAAAAKQAAPGRNKAKNATTTSGDPDSSAYATTKPATWKGKGKATIPATDDFPATAASARREKPVQSILSHPDARLGEAGCLTAIPITKPLAAIRPAIVDVEAMLSKLRAACVKALPDGRDPDGSPVLDYQAGAKMLGRRFIHPYQAWRFVESYFGSDFDDSHMAVVRDITQGKYGYRDQSGAEEIVAGAQLAAVDEAHLLSAMATDPTISRQARREEGDLITFDAVQQAPRPAAFDWVERLMASDDFQSHDYAGALQRLQLKSALYPRLRGMVKSTKLYWWQVLGIDRIEETRRQGKVKGIILADYVGLGKTLQMAGWMLHVSFPLRMGMLVEGFLIMPLLTSSPRQPNGLSAEAFPARSLPLPFCAR